VDRNLEGHLLGSGPTQKVTFWGQGEADGVKAPGYQRVRMEKVASAYQAAAEWEYTFDGPDGRRLHAINRGFRTAGERAFVIMWQTSDFDYQTDQANYQLMTVSFTPPP
jgi:hypothetical protein